MGGRSVYLMPRHVERQLNTSISGQLSWYHRYPTHWEFMTLNGKVIGIRTRPYYGPHPVGRPGMTVARSETLFDLLVELDTP